MFHSSFQVPVKTSTAGPSRNASSCLSQDIRRVPPSTTTSTVSSTSPSFRAAVAAAVLPVPDDNVSPAPRSKILVRMRFGAIMFTISKFMRCGNMGWFSTVGPILFRGKSSTGSF